MYTPLPLFTWKNTGVRPLSSLAVLTFDALQIGQETSGILMYIIKGSFLGSVPGIGTGVNGVYFGTYSTFRMDEIAIFSFCYRQQNEGNKKNMVRSGVGIPGRICIF